MMEPPHGLKVVIWIVTVCDANVQRLPMLVQTHVRRIEQWPQVPIVGAAQNVCSATEQPPLQMGVTCVHEPQAVWAVHIVQLPHAVWFVQFVHEPQFV
jgi:hypothetical protein